MQPSQACRAKARPTKSPGNAYTADTYGQAIKYAIEKARRAGIVIESWSPNRLRHTRATELRETVGIEAAAATLGHSDLRTTEIYAKQNEAMALRVAAQTG